MEQEKEDKEEEETRIEEEKRSYMLKVTETENNAKDTNIVDDSNTDILKSRMTYMQVQMDDMEKSIITLMRVTNDLMCRAMVGVVSSQTKIRKTLKKMGKTKEMKDQFEEEGLDWREYVSQIGEYWDLIVNAK